MDRRSFVLSSLIGVAGTTFRQATSATARASGFSGAPAAIDPSSPPGSGLEPPNINRENDRIRYASGGVVYIEELVQGRWAGRNWGAGGQTPSSGAFWTSDAFEIRIKTEPTPDSVPGTLVATGWRLEASTELPSTEKGKMSFCSRTRQFDLPPKVKSTHSPGRNTSSNPMA